VTRFGVYFLKVSLTSSQPCVACYWIRDLPEHCLPESQVDRGIADVDARSFKFRSSGDTSPTSN